MDAALDAALDAVLAAALDAVLAAALDAVLAAALDAACGFSVSCFGQPTCPHAAKIASNTVRFDAMP